MKTRSLSFAATAVLAVGPAALLASIEARAQTCFQVEVQNVRAEQGTLMIAAYADSTSFNHTPAVALQIKAGVSTMAFPLCGIAGKSVALMVFQDLNGNGKLDRNVLGIPSEPWGASGKPAAMTAPTWDTTVVPLDGMPIVVKLSK